jgi:hypothetical protein
VTQELFAGRLPHWTPYAGFGFPLLADIEATVLPKFYLGLGITVATAIGALHIALRPVTRDRAARPH